LLPLKKGWAAAAAEGGGGIPSPSLSLTQMNPITIHIVSVHPAMPPIADFHQSPAPPTGTETANYVPSQCPGETSQFGNFRTDVDFTSWVHCVFAYLHIYFFIIFIIRL
jgi:hypothetical protein